MAAFLVAAVVWLAAGHLGSLDTFLTQSIGGLVRYELGDYGGAARAYREALAARFDSAGLDLDDPEVSYLQNDVVRAGALAARARASEPTNASPLVTLAELAMDAGQVVEAREHLALARDLAPGDVDVLTLSALAAARAGADGDAIRWMGAALRDAGAVRRPSVVLHLLEAAEDLAARKPAPACVLAHVHRFLRVYDPSQARVAIAWAERALAAGDHPSDAHLTIGIVRFKLVEDDAALAALEKALEVDPRNAEAHRWAAVVYEQRGELERQLLALRRAHDIQSDDPAIASALMEVLTDRLGDPQAALEVGLRVLEPGGRSLDVMRRTGFAYDALGRYDEAADRFAAAVAMAPADAWSHYGVGLVRWHQRRFTEAIAAYERAVELRPDYASARLSLMVAYREVGRIADAVRELEAVFRLAPDKWRYAIELCHLYLLDGRLADARGCAERQPFRAVPTAEATFLAEFDPRRVVAEVR